jgi:hypothetical protein
MTKLRIEDVNRRIVVCVGCECGVRLQNLVSAASPKSRVNP